MNKFAQQLTELNKAIRSTVESHGHFHETERFFVTGIYNTSVYLKQCNSPHYFDVRIRKLPKTL